MEELSLTIQDQDVPLSYEVELSENDASKENAPRDYEIELSENDGSKGADSEEVGLTTPISTTINIKEENIALDTTIPSLPQHPVDYSKTTSTKGKSLKNTTSSASILQKYKVYELKTLGHERGNLRTLLILVNRLVSCFQ